MCSYNQHATRTFERNLILLPTVHFTYHLVFFGLLTLTICPVAMLNASSYLGESCLLCCPCFVVMPCLFWFYINITYKRGEKSESDIFQKTPSPQTPPLHVSGAPRNFSQGCPGRATENPGVALQNHKPVTFQEFYYAVVVNYLKIMSI